MLQAGGQAQGPLRIHVDRMGHSLDPRSTPCSVHLSAIIFSPKIPFYALFPSYLRGQQHELLHQNLF